MIANNTPEVCRLMIAISIKRRSFFKPLTAMIIYGKIPLYFLFFKGEIFMKRIMSLLLSLVMITSAVLCVDLSAFATDAYVSNRAEWLSKLTQTFDMTVEDDNYPDNYFSDLTSDSEYYYDVLLAVEFGLVDIEAGDPVNPEGDITREFAAQTLNFCLKWELDKGDDFEYSFADWESCAYPDDDQVAVDHNWLALDEDNKFNPTQKVTADEINTMLDDAEETLRKNKVDDNYSSSYSFSDSTKQIPKSTTVDFYENYIVIHSADCGIESGDSFVVFSNNLPVLYKAESVTAENGTTTVTVSDDIDETAIEYADIQEVVPADTNNFIPAEGYEIVRRSNHLASQYGTLEITRNSIELERDVTLPDNSHITVHVGLSDLMLSAVFNTRDGIYSAQVSCKANVGFSVDGEREAAINNNSLSVDLFSFGRFFFYGIGYVELKPDLELSGTLEFTQSFDLVVGVCLDNNVVHLINSFKRGEFRAIFEAEGRIGLKVEVGVRVLTQKMNFYAKIGSAAKATLEINVDSKGKNLICVTLNTYLYFDIGAEIQVKFRNWKTLYNLNIPIFTETNSPIRLYFHYENSVRVPACTAHDGYTSPNDYEAPATIGHGMETVELRIYAYSDHAEVSNCFGNPTNVVIPSTYVYEEYVFGEYVKRHVPVTKINGCAFASCKSLTSITIPDSVTIIDDDAFRYCTGLSSITIPNSVKSIGDLAFYHCTSLTSITIPNRVTSINWAAFAECTSLTSITIPSSVTSIGYNAFAECTSLTRITIPSSVTSIGSEAFEECTSLTSITIPNSVTSMGRNPFTGCSGLTSINVSSGNAKYDSRNNCNAIIEKSTNTLFCGCKNTVIPNSVTSIGNHAFSGCTGLTSITIPDSVTSIGDYAFSSCKGLSSITIPNSVTSIGKCAFEYCKGLTSVTIPDSVTSIGDFAFNNCTGLTSITIPDSVTNIGIGAFSGCKSLTSITIPNSVLSIGRNPFSACSGLTSINVSEDNTEYDSRDNCNAIIEKSTNTLISGCVNTVMPSNVTTIGDSAFNSCTGLTSITIPDSVTSIGDYAFSSCKSLTSITIPNSVTSIGNQTFVLSNNLKDVYYTGSESEWKAISIGYNNNELTNATIHFNYVPPHDHNYTAVITAPTCTEKGYTIYTCTICGDTYSDNETDPFGHNWGDWVSSAEVAPTCTENGSTEREERRCTVCGTDETRGGEEVAALGHDYTSVVTAPNCTKGGYTTYTCTRCGDAYTGDETAATGHSFGDWDVTTAASCTAKGVETRKCANCDVTETRDVAALGHTVVTDKAVAATFKAAGKTEGKHCSRCGKIITAQKSVAKLVSPTVSKLTAGKKSFTATWKKAPTVEGYQLQYATKSNFSKAKSVTVKKDSTTKTTVKKLSAKKKYYVRVRAYKTINGKKVYSSWSKSKTVTTKK